MMNNDIDSLLNLAFDAYNARDFEQAEALTRDVLNAVPSHGDALYLLALIAYQSGALDPATDLLYQAVKLYPDIEKYQLTLASILQSQGHLEEALSRYLKFPDNPLSQIQCGHIYLIKKQNSFAKSAFNKALSLDPCNEFALLGIAKYYMSVGEEEKAIEELQQISEKSRLTDVFLTLSSLYRKKKDFSLALNTINRAILLDDNASNRIEQGLIFEAKKEYQQALDAYQTAVHLDPYRGDGWIDLGNMYYKLGQNRMAEDSYKRALQQDLYNEDANYNLAVLLQDEKRVAEALEYYRAVLSHNPSHTPSLYNLAIIQEQNDDLVEALGLYFNVLSQKGDFPDLEWRIADTLSALSKKGRKDQKLALTFAKGWVKNFPDNPIAEHTYSALQGKKEKKFPRAYIRQLYDSFADTYDQKMDQLQTKVIPELMKILDINHDDTESLLDLGCGTGRLADFCPHKIGQKVGVDCSAKMIDKAKEKNFYDSLVVSDIFEYLEENKEQYDVIIAAELVCYLSDVKELFSLVKKHLSKEGKFAFSVETTEKEDIALSENGRYLYHINYIEKCIRGEGFSLIVSKNIQLRREGNGFARGCLFVVSPMR